MDIEILRGEIERLFSLDELTALSRDLLGLDPHEVGGTNAKATFAEPSPNAARGRCRRCTGRGDLGVAHQRRSQASRLEPEGILRERSAGRRNHGGSLLRQPPARRRERGNRLLGRAQGQPVMLKLLRREAARDARSLHRFLTVSRLIGRVSDPRYRPDDRRPPRRRRPVLRRVRKYPRRVAGGAHSSRRPDAHEGGSPDSPRRARSARRAARSRDRPRQSQAREHHHRAPPRRTAGAGRRRRHRPPAPARACPEWAFAVRARARLAQDHRARADAREHRAAARRRVRVRRSALRSAHRGAGLQRAEHVDAAVAHLVEEPTPAELGGPRGVDPQGARPASFSRCSAKSRPRGPRTRGPCSKRSRTCREARSSARARRGITEEELEERIDAVLSRSRRRDRRSPLESAAQEGAETARIAQTFAMAAEEPSSRGAPYGQHQKNLLFRAARIYDGANDKESAERIYTRISQLDPDRRHRAKRAHRGAQVARASSKRSIEMLLARAETAAERRREGARHGRNRAHLRDRARRQGRKRWSLTRRLFAKTRETDAYADEVERLAGSDHAAWAEAIGDVRRSERRRTCPRAEGAALRAAGPLVRRQDRAAPISRCRAFRRS